MSRLAGDPGPLRWLMFAFGFRLPEPYTDWVRHELTDAGWRLRTVLRHLAIIVPICAAVAIVLLIWLPAPGWLAGMMIGLILAGSIFTVAAYADDIRATRLRQHGLDVPDDPDLGRPAHLLNRTAPDPARARARAPNLAPSHRARAPRPGAAGRYSARSMSWRAASVMLPVSEG